MAFRMTDDAGDAISVYVAQDTGLVLLCVQDVRLADDGTPGADEAGADLTPDDADRLAGYLFECAREARKATR